MLPAPSDLPRWRDQLYAVCGRPNGWLSWLEPVWHGDIGRMVLYQVIPPWATSPLFWAEEQERRVVTIQNRRAPDPRYRVALNPEALTWRQWQLYERFGAMAQPYWIVQGHRGGHKRQFSAVEQRLLAALGKPIDPPAGGDLSYAPLDQRVLDQLAQLDAMRLYGKAKALYERTPDDFDAEERDAIQRGSARLTAWLSEQVAEAFDDVLTYRKTAADVFHAVGDGPDRSEAMAEAVAREYQPSS